MYKFLYILSLSFIITFFDETSFRTFSLVLSNHNYLILCPQVSLSELSFTSLYGQLFVSDLLSESFIVTR